MNTINRDFQLSLKDNLPVQRLRALLESDHDTICHECERLAETGRQLAEALDALADAKDEIVALKAMLSESNRNPRPTPAESAEWLRSKPRCPKCKRLTSRRGTLCAKCLPF